MARQCTWFRVDIEAQAKPKPKPKAKPKPSSRMSNTDFMFGRPGLRPSNLFYLFIYLPLKLFNRTWLLFFFFRRDFWPCLALNDRHGLGEVEFAKATNAMVN